MRKRPPIPVTDDGAKYLTVVHPYPSHPNMKLPAHRKLFSQWVVACIGDPCNFRAFYYRPSSPGSIILAIDESMPDFGKILGAHKWSAFLTDPGSESEHVSKVFYSTYRSDQDVRDAGWNRVDVEVDWIAKRSKGIGNVIQPELCRPLPVATHPPPPPLEPAPVVGTPEWQEQKRRRDAPRPARGYVGGMPQSLNGTSAPTSTLSSPGLSPSPSRADKDALSRAHFAQFLSPSEAPSGSSASTGSGSVISTTREPTAHILVVGDNIEDDLMALTLGGDEEFGEDGTYFSLADNTAAADAPPSFPLCDSPQLEYAAPNGPGVHAEERLWSDDEPQDAPLSESSDEDDDRALIKAAEQDPNLCRVHNVVCSHGICREHGAKERDQKRRKRREEHRQEREEALAKRNKRRGKMKSSSSSTVPPSLSSNGGSTPETARSPPAHLRSSAAAPTSAGILRERPAHLRRGASSNPTSSPVSLDGCITSTPGQPQDADDADPRSEASSGVLGAAFAELGGAHVHSSTTRATAIVSTNVASAPIAQSSARHADGKGANGEGNIDGQNAQLVAGGSSTGYCLGALDGPWGSTDAVRQAGKGKGARAKTKMGADEIDERSVAPSSASWGNISAGTW